MFHLPVEQTVVFLDSLFYPAPLYCMHIILSTSCEINKPAVNKTTLESWSLLLKAKLKKKKMTSRKFDLRLIV